MSDQTRSNETTEQRNQDLTAIQMARPPAIRMIVLTVLFGSLGIFGAWLTIWCYRQYSVISIIGIGMSSGLFLLYMIPSSLIAITRKLKEDAENLAIDTVVGCIKTINGKKVLADSSTKAIPALDAKKLFLAYPDGVRLECRLSSRARVVLSARKIE
ncbi:MAG: hypothetical protein WCH99_13665 [Verrucomicrobiota bacterium]